MPDEPLYQQMRAQDWYGTNALDEELFVVNYFIPLRYLADWELIRLMSTVGTGLTHTSIWAMPDAGPDAIVRVDVSEQPSRPAAHDAAIELLRNFQSPDIRFDEQDDLGDLRFSGMGGAGRLFTRANLVVLVNEAGRTEMDIDGIARRIDDHVTSRPDDAEREMLNARAGGSGQLMHDAPIRVALDPAPGTATDSVVRIDIDDALQTPEDPAMIRIFTPTGTVVSDDRTLRYRQGSTDEHRVTVYVEPRVLAHGDECLAYELPD